ncbi:hypothetical protein [Reichenbachiella agariperforans]|uniref:hypothetical protein n=1 Tax=Reichenbachiella agariperforans TaxID=156994 RepID=UPI001FE7A6CB|nr:hypothetical protein [Reichenbachiella agariperforans]
MDVEMEDGTGYATSPQITGEVYAADMTPPTNTNLTTAVVRKPKTSSGKWLVN